MVKMSIIQLQEKIYPTPGQFLSSNSNVLPQRSDTNYKLTALILIPLNLCVVLKEAYVLVVYTKFKKIRYF